MLSVILYTVLAVLIPAEASCDGVGAYSVSPGTRATLRARSDAIEERYYRCFGFAYQTERIEFVSPEGGLKVLSREGSGLIKDYNQVLQVNIENRRGGVFTITGFYVYTNPNAGLCSMAIPMRDERLLIDFARRCVNDLGLQAHSLEKSATGTGNQ